jgi:hypothetical protein
MGLSIFKKDPAESRRTPFRDHLRKVNAKQIERQTYITRDATERRAQEAKDAAAANLLQRRTAIDQALADARYIGADPPALLEEYRAVADAESVLERCANAARGSDAVRHRCAADIARLNQEIADLNAQLPQLLHSALIESLGAEADEFKQAEATLRTVHRRVFVRALAADRLSVAHRLGEFTSSGLYNELNIPKPQHPAYSPEIADPYERGRALEAAVAARREDAVQLEKDADALINQLLTGESA